MSEKILAGLILLELSALVIIVALWFRAWLRKSTRITVGTVFISEQAGRDPRDLNREVSEGTDATKLV